LAEEIAARFDGVLADPAIPPAARVARIDDILESPRVDRREQLYKGEAGEQELHLLLDRIPANYLWLRLEVSCAPGSGSASLRKLRVRYPDRSWLDDLPAIYRDDPGPAAQLRQFLAPFEALYGEIDETIDRLPALIHPATAPDERLSWLLGWLGFPRPPACYRPSNASCSGMRATCCSGAARSGPCATCWKSSPATGRGRGCGGHERIVDRRRAPRTLRGPGSAATPGGRAAAARVPAR
jgi:hypothetical protein